jgi:hypothetical protein
MENHEASSDGREAVLTGHCMCGAVSFQIDQPLIGAACCYCKRCQRRTGTGFSGTGLTVPGSFTYTGGADSVKVYSPGDGGWDKAFCSICGSQINTTNPENPDLLAVRLGALDQDPGVRPLAHQYVDYASDWFPVPDDGLPHFPERLDWSQVDLGS